MAILKLKPASFGALPMAVLSVLLLISLYLMAEATRNSEELPVLVCPQPAVSFGDIAPIETAARRIWLVNPYNASFGNA